jgi:hypothetical protein
VLGRTSKAAQAQAKTLLSKDGAITVIDIANRIVEPVAWTSHDGS